MLVKNEPLAWSAKLLANNSYGAAQLHTRAVRINFNSVLRWAKARAQASNFFAHSYNIDALGAQAKRSLIYRSILRASTKIPCSAMQNMPRMI